MRMKAIVELILLVFPLIFSFFNPIVWAVEERTVLSRNYVGLGVEIYAPYQRYPGENITVKVRIEALENVKNVSVTLFLWGSKSEGSTPWSISFTVLELTDFPNGTIRQEAYNITLPSDIDPGLMYGILSLDWSIYRASLWEPQWDKASFRTTYVRNRNYENLQESYIQLEDELHNTWIIAYIFLAITIALAISIICMHAHARSQKARYSQALLRRGIRYFFPLSLHLP